MCDVPNPIGPWVESLLAGSPQAYAELREAIEDGCAAEWVSELAMWAAETGTVSLSLERLIRSLRSAGMPYALARALVRDMRGAAKPARVIAPPRSLDADRRLADAVLDAAENRADASRIIRRDGYAHLPVDMGRAVFQRVGITTADLASWRESGLLRCEPGVLTVRLRMVHDGRRNYYAILEERDVGEPECAL